MKEVQELAIEIARLGMLTGHPEWVEAAKRLEMFASALPLPYSIYEEPLNAVLDALPPEGIPAMMQGAVTFQIRYKKESCAQGFISKEDEDLVTTGPSWRWDDREKRHGMVMRGGREDRQYLAELVLERKLGRPLKSGEYVVYTNGVLTDLRRENITLGDLQEALYMQRKKGNAHLIGVKPTKGGKWQAYRSTTEEERAQGKTGSSQNIGVYDTAIEAALAYDEAVTRLRWPKKTRLNFPKSI